MNIQVISVKVTHYPNLGRYYFAELAAGTHSATVMVAPDYLQIIVHNASHRAWRRMGRRFSNATEALAQYKTPEIRAMIEAAVSGAQVAA